MPLLSTYQRNRLLMALAAAAACVLFWFAGAWVGIPRHVGFENSLALQPSAAADLLLTGIVILVATAVGTVLAGSIRFDAGLFAAAVGLAALSCRGGPMRYVTQAAAGRGLFLALALELVVLGALLGLAWFGLWLLYRAGYHSGDALRDGLRDQSHEVSERVYALLMQVAVMSVIVMLLARTDDKKQVLAAVTVASFAATLMSYAFSPVRPSVWYWAGPVLVGTLGYLVAYFSAGSMESVGWKSGAGGGLLSSQARPLPLDYASLGTAGAIAGYWTSRQWQRAKELEKEAAAA
jgi:hypothetical protein